MAITRQIVNCVTFAATCDRQYSAQSGRMQKFAPVHNDLKSLSGSLSMPPASDAEKMHAAWISMPVVLRQWPPDTARSAQCGAIV